MILIAQRGHGPANAPLIARLFAAGHHVLVATAADEAAEILDRFAVGAVLINDPHVPGQCSRAFCRYILDTVDSPPPLLGLARIDDPAQRDRCQACMGLLDPELPPATVAARVATLAG